MPLPLNISKQVKRPIECCLDLVYNLFYDSPFLTKSFQMLVLFLRFLHVLFAKFVSSRVCLINHLEVSTIKYIETDLYDIYVL